MGRYTSLLPYPLISSPLRNCWCLGSPQLARCDPFAPRQGLVRRRYFRMDIGLSTLLRIFPGTPMKIRRAHRPRPVDRHNQLYVLHHRCSYQCSMLQTNRWRFVFEWCGRHSAAHEGRCYSTRRFFAHDVGRDGHDGCEARST